VQIAINADFFYPWYTSSITQYHPHLADLKDPKSLPKKLWDYYPHSGDPVTVQGLSASRGKQTNDSRSRRESYPTLFLSRGNVASFFKPTGSIYNAVSGGSMLLNEGERPVLKASPYFIERHPRTAAGVDKTGKWLILVVADGRQTNYSEGATIPELMDIMEEHGAWTAMNLDGGGSTALVIEGKHGEPVVLNVPIDHGIPGRERPVANHLGVFVGKSASER
jgi:hypothetical protein